MSAVQGPPKDSLAHLMLEATGAGFWDLDLATGEVTVQGRFFERIGVEPGSAHRGLLDELMRTHVHADDFHSVRGAMDWRLAQGADEVAGEFRIVSAQHAAIWVRARGRVLSRASSGAPLRVCGWIEDVTRGRDQQAVVRGMLGGMETLSGQAFFERLVVSLAETLDTRYASIIVPVDVEKMTARTLALCDRQRIIDNFTYNVATAPCLRALQHGSYFQAERIGELFPEAAQMKKMDVQSFFGIALRDPSGALLGGLAAMDDKPMEPDDLRPGIVALFGARAAAELQRLRAERERDETERRSRLLFEQATIGIAILKPACDEAGQVTDLALVDCNPWFESMVGRRAAEVRGIASRQLVPHISDLIRDRLIEVLRTGRRFETEIRSSRSGRSYELRAIRMEEGLVATLCQEVTALVKARREAVEAEARWRQTLERLPAVAVVIDSSRRVVFCNEHTATLLGWPRDEIVGRDWIENFLPPSEQANFKAYLDSPSGWGGFPSHDCSRVLVRDGSTRLIDWDLTLLLGLDGEVAGIAGVGRDLTARQAAEEERKHARHLEAVGRLAGGVAHEFNNLLTVVNGYTRLAQTLVPASGPVSGHLREVAQAGERLAVITRKLLAFSGRLAVDRRPVELNRLIEKLAPELRRLAGGRAELAFDLSAQPDSVLADPAQLELVVMHLVANAVEAVAGDGRVSVSTAVNRSPSVVQDASLTPGPYVELRVADSGSGMSRDHIARLFEPFYTTKDAASGSGLGLPVVYGIVKQCGGEISVESEPGRGSVFHVFLPVVAAALADPPAPVPARRLRVLVADDEQGVRLLLRSVLEDEGYEVLDAPDGRQAMKILESTAVDVLVTDLVMPGQEGIETIRAARARHPNLKIVAISGAFLGQFLKMAEKLGADAVLQKPFRPEALSQTLAGLLGRPNQ